MNDDLPALPLDDVTLDAIDHALKFSLTTDESGQLVSSGSAEYSLSTLLDFLGGTMGRDPNEILIRPGRDESDLPEWERGRDWSSAEIVEDTRTHYSERDLVRALVAEVRLLRAENKRLRDELERAIASSPTVAALIDRVERAERERDEFTKMRDAFKREHEWRKNRDAELLALRAAVAGLADELEAEVIGGLTGSVGRAGLKRPESKYADQLRALLTEGADDGE